jgi:hypothetical protein
MSAKAILSASVSAPPVFVEDVFSTFLYTGNSSTQTITNGIDLSGKGGLVWLKNRSNASTSNVFGDTARGGGKILYSDTTGAQSTGTWGVNSFSSSGFGLTGVDSYNNLSAANYCSWTFRKQPKFFDVVTYTGDGTDNRAIAHNLGSVPGCIIVKSTSGGYPWAVKHRSLSSASQYLVLNDTAAETTTFNPWTLNPTSTVFYVNGVASSLANGAGASYVAYVFAHDAGGFGTAGTDNVVSCGTFSSPAGSATVTLGYEPQFILFKRSDGAESWYIADIMRGSSRTQLSLLYPNLSQAESSYSGEYLFPTATGFELKGLGLVGNYIYIAIRRGPMKTPTVGTSVFALNEGTGSTSGQSVTTNFPVDMSMTAYRTLGGVAVAEDRIRGYGTANTNGATPTLTTSSTAAEATGSGPRFYNAWNTTITRGSNGADPGGGIISWFFRRAPGFFDVVAYTGTGSNTQTVAHNLAVIPELLILKGRSAGTGYDMNWITDVKNNDGKYSYFLGNAGLSSNAAATLTDFPVLVNGTIATSTYFTPYRLTASSPYGGYTASQTYITYLFATLAGVSKVGSYTGTGTTKQIDCGFTAGARFVMIKRTDSTGDWYVWDTARGIISGNDSYLLLNSAAAEVTGTDYIDPLSSGFEISSTAPAAINANGGNFIFLAIA